MVKKIDGELRPLFRQHLPRVFWTSVETPLTGGGTPDSHGINCGVPFWVEYKKTTGWTVPLRPAQVGWALRYRRNGGRILIATRRQAAAGARREKADELWVHDGAFAAILKRDGLRGAKPLSIHTGGPTKWDWSRIIYDLTTVPLSDPPAFSEDELV